MSPAAFSVRRPVFASMVAMIVVVLGLVALQRLQIDMLPAIEIPTLSVTTEYEGADPEVVERLVTQIVEEIIGTVPGVTELSSESSEGRSRIRAEFSWGTNLDSAANDVRARLEEELSELPDDVQRPQLRKFDVASFPVVLLGISSETFSPVELNELADRDIRQRFARLAGVAQVDLWGGYARELRIELEPDRVRALGLSLPEVITRLREANQDLPAGSINAGRFEVTLRAPAELANLEEVADVIIATREGTPITLGQVARILDTHAEIDRVIRVGSQRGIRVAIRKQPEANTVEVAQRILAEIEAVNQEMPQVDIVPVINQGDFIQRSITNVANSVLYGGVLAILVLLFFLRDIRSTLVIGLAIPLSIMATLAAIYIGGLTLNLMTLGGLALAVGMMVDNAIVVLENIFRRRDEEHEEPAVAAVAGTSEVASAIVASTITTLVIFLPLAFVEGVPGLLFGELALVVVYGLIASLAVALTLVPMLAAKFLQRSASVERETWRARLSRRAGRSLQVLDTAYAEFLTSALRHRLFSIGAVLILLAGSLLLWPRIGTEFMPPSDEGEVRVDLDFGAGTRLDLADAGTRIAERIINESVPEVLSKVTSVSASGQRGGASTTADIRLNVGSSRSRSRSNEAIAEDLRQRLVTAVPGATVRVRAPQGQFLLERLLGNAAGLQIQVRGDDLEIIGELVEAISGLAATVPGVAEVEDDLERGMPQEHLLIDRAKVADLGLSVQDVGQALEAAMAGRLAGDYRPAGVSIPIRVQLADRRQLPLAQVLDQTLRTPAGEEVALANLLTTEPGRGPSKITRIRGARTATIKLELGDRDAGSVAADLESRLREVPRPTGYNIRLAGSHEQQQDAFGQLSLSFLLAILLVYMVLACQYESLRDPLVVMFAVPVAAIGVLTTLYITGSTFNIQSAIGCIMLGGIVVNNAILLVDQAGRLRLAGVQVMAAVAEAGRRRLRPILMTTSTTVLGLLPLALGIGEGAEAQAPLARAVVGGLIASTVITLVLVPVLYTIFYRQRSVA